MSGSRRPSLIEPYIGYSVPDGAVVRGRVLSEVHAPTGTEGASRWQNFRAMLRLFLTDEVADVAVTAAGVTGRSDAEGYVTLTVPIAGQAPWTEVPLRVEGSDVEASCPVRVPGPGARHLVISDIDDTVIETGAHSLARNLWTTFTGSTLTRRVHEDARALLSRASDGERNPVFYVSSSPWNLHGFLLELFRRNGVPLGPMFLRDYGISGTPGGHLGHKGASIDEILAAAPGLPAYLMGDTGQKDARVYLDAVERHGAARAGGRIAGVALRQPTPGTVADDEGHIAQIEALGVPCYSAPSFAGAAAHWGWDA